MKKYENRNMTVSTVFNPYITPGFPGVVYDTVSGELTDEDSVNANLKFIGHVTVVSHTLTKNSVSTQVQFGFTRLLTEEVESPLTATLEQISDDVTHKVGPMQEIYETLLGPASTTMDINALQQESGGEAFTKAQTNPLEAYKYISRNIMTKKEYKEFMPEVSITSDPRTGDMTGSYFTNRLDSSLPGTLKEVVNFQSNRNVFKE
jgi:hypothetical protein